MALLNERQTIAARLARELERFEDVWITSPMPLRDGEKLRLQVADRFRNEVVQIVRDLGYEMTVASVLPRVCPTGLMAACLYEIPIAAERQPIVDDRKIYGELAKPEKSSYERESILKYLGIQK